MDNFIATKIEGLNLTKAQQKIADYFIHNQEKIVTLSSMDVAKAVGVSDASVIRFSRALGYKGFAELKGSLYDTIVKNRFSTLSLTGRMKVNNEILKNSNITKQFLMLMQGNFDFIFRNNSIEKFENIANRIVCSKHKCVIGLRGCRGIAVQFSRLLSFMLPYVICVTDTECTSISSVQDLEQDDCVLFFVFSRFYKTDIHYLKIAKERGAYVVMITNDVTGPATKYADQVLVIETNSVTFFNSTLGMDLASEYLLTLICHHSKNQYEDRINERDLITAEQRL